MRWRSIALVGGAALVLASAATAARAPSPTPRHWSTDAPPAPAAATVATHKDDASLGGVGVGGGARGAAAVAHAAPRKLPPLLPLTASTAATLVLAAIALAVAAAGGIGGGGVLVPLYLLLLGAPPRDAVALSNATILGGAIASLAFNVQRVTAAGAPVIDWDVVLAMEPSTVVGAVAGAIANKVVPGWLTTASLTLLLAAMTAKLAARAREARQAENDARRSDGEGLLAAEAPKPPSLAGVPDEPPPGPAFPLAKVAALGGLCAVVAASDGAKKAVRCGSPAYWAASLAVLPPALFLAWRTRVRLLAETAAAGQGSAAAGHVRWTRRTTLLFPALSTAAGAVAGLFGVGGGIVKAPLMLELGVPPDVAAATSGESGEGQRRLGSERAAAACPRPPLLQSP